VSSLKIIPTLLLTRVNIGNAYKDGLGFSRKRESWWFRRLDRQTRYPTKNTLEAKVVEIILELGFATMCGVTSVSTPSVG
jgi:hypothetical protein